MKFIQGSDLIHTGKPWLHHLKLQITTVALYRENNKKNLHLKRQKKENSNIESRLSLIFILPGLSLSLILSRPDNQTNSSDN